LDFSTAANFKLFQSRAIATDALTVGKSLKASSEIHSIGQRRAINGMGDGLEAQIVMIVAINKIKETVYHQTTVIWKDPRRQRNIQEPDIFEALWLPRQPSNPRVLLPDSGSGEDL
jgi:hypothetical protein